MDFKNKVIIVTGSSSGIGAATAIHFANLSAKLVIVGRNEERLKSIAKNVEDSKGIIPLVIKADMSKDDDVKTIIDETLKVFGQIDVLVNNAGGGTMSGITDGIEPFDKNVSLNLRSVYLITSLATPHLIKTKGNIINVSSIASAKVYPTLAYCVAKAGLDMFTKCVAKELAIHGIRVNSVNPGPVKTNFGGQMSKDQIEGFVDTYTRKSLLGYISTTDNIADLIIFLASDKARSITGSIYVIDNGESLV